MKEVKDYNEVPITPEMANIIRIMLGKNCTVVFFNRPDLNNDVESNLEYDFIKNNQRKNKENET